jgi:hypothetical protein
MVASDFPDLHPSTVNLLRRQTLGGDRLTGRMPFGYGLGLLAKQHVPSCERWRLLTDIRANDP